MHQKCFYVAINNANRETYRRFWPWMWCTVIILYGLMFILMVPWQQFRVSNNCNLRYPARGSHYVDFIHLDYLTDKYKTCIPSWNCFYIERFLFLIMALKLFYDKEKAQAFSVLVWKVYVCLLSRSVACWNNKLKRMWVEGLHLAKRYLQYTQ